MQQDDLPYRAIIMLDPAARSTSLLFAALHGLGCIPRHLRHCVRPRHAGGLHLSIDGLQPGDLNQAALEARIRDWVADAGWRPRELGTGDAAA